MTRADQLLEDIAQRRIRTNLGRRANDLLEEFQRGYPVYKLLTLLFNDDDEVAAIGMFIASELGSHAKPILDDVVSLINHPTVDMRLGVIDVVLMCAGIDDAPAIAQVVAMIDDDVAGVRWNALGFGSRASVPQLTAALEYLEESEPTSPHVRGLRWLLSSEGGDVDTAIKLIRGDDSLLRKYEVIAAARMVDRDQGPLKAATLSDDHDVAHFATTTLKLTNLRFERERDA